MSNFCDKYHQHNYLSLVFIFHAEKVERSLAFLHPPI